MSSDTTALQRVDAVAGAAFVGWLPLALINAVFVARVDVPLSALRRAQHHLYDAGQIVGLAACSWLVVQLVWRLRLAARITVGLALLFAASYGLLLGGDLESFIERHPDSSAPFRLIFAAALTGGAALAVSIGWLVARNERRVRGVRVGAAACLAMGLALASANHLVLTLAYPGTHFLVAWVASSWIGASALPRLGARDLPRHLRIPMIAASVLSLLAYGIPPGSVVRTALLRSTGAVAAPFAGRAWALVQHGAATVPPGSAAWFSPRRGRPAIPPDELPGMPETPIVILVTLDALRNDIVELDEHAAAVPNLRAMAKASLRFARTWSPAACTGPTLRQIFLGTYYSQHAGPADRGPFLSALLERGGAHTVIVRTYERLARGHGIAEGFGKERDIGEKASSMQVVKQVLAELTRRPKGPFFIYAHSMETHAPYNRALKVGTPKERYIAEVSLADAAIGKLRREIVKRGLGGATYLIVTSDHGEGFYEHGYRYHATTMYEEMIRVPLLIEGPGVKPRRVERSVSLIDLGPTILSLFGQPTPGHFMGESLIPFMRGATPDFRRPLAAENHNGIQAMLFRDRMKAIVDNRTGTEELYDLERDPHERHNLAEREDAAPHFATLRAFFANLARPSIQR